MYYSNRPGTPAAAARLLTSRVVAERPATVDLTLLLLVSTLRPLRVRTATNRRLVRTRVAASLRRLRHTRPRPLVAMTVRDTIRCDGWHVSLLPRRFEF